MDSTKIITNSHRREVTDAWQLTSAEREQFDYLNWAAIDDGRDSASFVRYHGELIDLGDTEGGYGGSNPFPGWDTYISDSFFSGIVIRYVHDEYDASAYTVIVGRYFS